QGKSSSHKPRAGTAGSGKPLDPATVPDAPDPAARPDAPRSMPGPGLPISDEEYEALKRKARTDPTPATRAGQEEPSTKKKPEGRVIPRGEESMVAKKRRKTGTRRSRTSSDFDGKPLGGKAARGREWNPAEPAFAAAAARAEVNEPRP